MSSANLYEFDIDDAKQYGFIDIENQEKNIQNAEYIRAYLNLIDFESSTDCFKNAGIESKKGMVFCGPKGTGKHTAAATVVATLLKNKFRSWAWINSHDFVNMSKEEAIEKLNSYFADYINGEIESDPNRPFDFKIILIENLEKTDYGAELTANLESLLYLCEIGEVNIPFVILTTNELREDSCLSDILTPFKFDLLSKDSVIALLNKTFVFTESDGKVSEREAHKIRVNAGGMNLGELTEKMDGISYSQFEQGVYLAKLKVMSKASRDLKILKGEDLVISEYPIEMVELSKIFDKNILRNAPKANLSLGTLSKMIPDFDGPTGKTVNTRAETAEDILNLPPEKRSEKFDKLNNASTYDPVKQKLVKIYAD